MFACSLDRSTPSPCTRPQHLTIQPSGGQAPHSGVGYYVTLNPDTVTSLHTSLPPAVSAATSGARQQEVESVQVIFAH